MSAHYLSRIAIGAIAATLWLGLPCIADTPASTPSTAADFRKLAETAKQANDLKTAIDDYQHAFDIDKDAHPSDAANDQMEIGGIYDAEAVNQKAIDAYTTALDVYTSAKDESGEAYAYRRRGLTYRVMADLDKAVVDERAAIEIDRRVKSTLGQAYDLYNLGMIAEDQKQYAPAEGYYGQALNLFIDASDVDYVIDTLNKIAGVQWSQKRYKDAQASYAKVVLVAEKLKRPVDAGVALENHGLLYLVGQDWAKARKDFEKAIGLLHPEKATDNEADANKYLAQALLGQGDFKAAVDVYGRARKLYIAAKDDAGEIDCMLGIAGTYSGMTQTRTALPLELAIIQKARAINNPNLLARGLMFYAQDLTCSGNAQDSFAQLDEALTINKDLPDSGALLSSLYQCYGSACEELNRYSQAVDYFHQAYDAAGRAKDPNSQARVLVCLGYVYERINQHGLAMKTQKRAIELFKKTNDPEAISIAQLNIAFSYNALGRYNEGIALFRKALVTIKASHVDDDTARCLAYIGEAHFHLHQYDKALASLNQSLPYIVKVDDKELQAMVEVDLGVTYLSNDQYKEANKHLRTAVVIARRAGSREREAAALSGLMKVASKEKHTGMGIFFGKQAVSCYQGIRGDIVNMGNKSQSTYLIAHADTYRMLAELLISVGRLPEAQQVLNMLKGDEFKDFVRRDAADASSPDTPVAYRSDETDWRQRYDQIADQVTALGGRMEDLQGKKRAAAEGGGTFTPADQAELMKTIADLEVANQAFYAALDEITAESSNLNAAQNRTVENLADTTALAGALKKMGPGTVALYTIVEPDKYRVLVITSQTQKAEEYTIPAADLNAKILQFRDVLQNPKVDPRPLGKELYDILIGPIEKDLAGAKAQVLMWSLDGTLRYLPLAALWDGSHYLVERYALSVFTPASMSRLGDDAQKDWTGLGLGVSKSHVVTDPTTKQSLRFNPLPGARAELTQVMGGVNDAAHIIPGVVLLDEAFTRASMIDSLASGKYAVVHIASHFAFRPGHDTDSFLLLGDGTRLTLADFKRLPHIFQGTDLLTLSACETAVGDVGADGREVEGLGVEAQRQGAEAVLASLWSVDDSSTQELMQDFYHDRETVNSISKAEALRRAQLQLIHGTPDAPLVPIKPTAKRGIERGDIDDATEMPVLAFKKDPKAPFAHPYYWAPFILIGNWK